MKTLILLAGVALCCSAFVNPKTTVKRNTVVYAKAVNAPFTYFRAHRIANDVSLNWGIANPLQVEKFTIKYSYDNDWWLDYEGPAIMCNGNATFRQRISAFPGTTYYKIIAEMNDGSIMESIVESVRIVKRG